MLPKSIIREMLKLFEVFTQQNTALAFVLEIISQSSVENEVGFMYLAFKYLESAEAD